MSISARNIHVRIGAADLLFDISLDVHPGEVLAVLGPNGAGKSSLLKTLSGDLTPVHGSVSMSGRPLSDWSRESLARSRAVLMQNSTLSFGFSVLDVVMMGRLPWQGRTSARRNAEIARAALAAADVAHLESRCYTTLSGGEQQRVHLARVLAQVWETPPDTGRYLLFDEPVASLDLPHQHATLALARRFASDGFGVFVVMHDLNLAAQYADRIALLKSGQLVLLGTPSEVLCSDGIDQVFGISVQVVPHPLLPIPLVIAGASRSAILHDGAGRAGNIVARDYPRIHSFL